VWVLAFKFVLPLICGIGFCGMNNSRFGPGVQFRPRTEGKE